jgi:hypothetical protein
MNTPAHALAALALLARGEDRRHAWPIFLGATLPDLPIFGFFVWQHFVLATPGPQIWDTEYFRAGWQDLFDVFNSVPIALAVLLLATALHRRAAALMAAAMLLHFGLDLPLHHDDGHRHFFPFSDWRFASSVSYWDPRHHGAWGAALEVGVVLAASAALWRRGVPAWGGALLAITCALSLVGYVAFYGFGLLP